MFKLAHHPALLARMYISRFCCDRPVNSAHHRQMERANRQLVVLVRSMSRVPVAWRDCMM